MELHHQRRHQNAALLSLRLQALPPSRVPHHQRPIHGHLAQKPDKRTINQRNLLGQGAYFASSIKMEPGNDTSAQILSHRTVFPWMPCHKCRPWRTIKPLCSGEHPMAGRGGPRHRRDATGIREWTQAPRYPPRPGGLATVELRGCHARNAYCGQQPSRAPPFFFVRDCIFRPENCP